MYSSFADFHALLVPLAAWMPEDYCWYGAFSQGFPPANIIS